MLGSIFVARRIGVNSIHGDPHPFRDCASTVSVFYRRAQNGRPRRCRRHSDRSKTESTYHRQKNLIVISIAMEYNLLSVRRPSRSDIICLIERESHRVAPVRAHRVNFQISITIGMKYNFAPKGARGKPEANHEHSSSHRVFYFDNAAALTCPQTSGSASWLGETDSRVFHSRGLVSPPVGALVN